MPQHRTHYPACEADTRHTQLCKFGEGEFGRTTKNIDWPIDRLDERGNRVTIKHANGIDAIGTGLQIGISSLHCMLEAALRLSHCQQKNIDTCVNHKRHIYCSG